MAYYPHLEKERPTRASGEPRLTPASTCLEGRMLGFLSHGGLLPLICFHDLPPSEL